MDPLFRALARSKAEVESLYPPFRQKVERLLKDLNSDPASIKAGVVWGVFDGIRGVEEQRKAYLAGRSKCDGVRIRSRHQDGLAADVVPIVKGQWTWSVKQEIWQILGRTAKAAGLEWGGGWKMRDYPHVEPKDASTMAKAAREWLKGAGR